MKSYAANSHSRAASFDSSLLAQEQTSGSALHYPPAGVYHQRSATVGSLPLTAPPARGPSPLYSSADPAAPARTTADIYRRGLDALPSHPSAARSSHGVLHPIPPAAPALTGRNVGRVLPPPPPPSPLVLQREQIPLRGDRASSGRLALMGGSSGAGGGGQAGGGGRQSPCGGHTAGAYSLGSGPKFQWVSTGDTAGRGSSGHVMSRSMGSSPFGLVAPDAAGSGGWGGGTPLTTTPCPSPAPHTTAHTEGGSGRTSTSPTHVKEAGPATPEPAQVEGGSVLEYEQQAVEEEGGEGQGAGGGAAGQAGAFTHGQHSGSAPGRARSSSRTPVSPGGTAAPAASLPPDHEVVPSLIARLGWSAAAQDNLRAYLAAGGAEAAAVLASLLSRYGVAPTEGEVRGVVAWAHSKGQGTEGSSGGGGAGAESSANKAQATPGGPNLSSPADAPPPSSAAHRSAAEDISRQGQRVVGPSTADNAWRASTASSDRPVSLSMSPEASPVSTPSPRAGEEARAFHASLPTGRSLGSPGTIGAQRPDATTRPGFLPATIVHAWSPVDPLAPCAAHELALPEGAVGQEVMVLHWEREGWFYGRTSAGKEGWFPSSSVALLAQPPPEHGVGVHGSGVDPATGERVRGLTPTRGAAAAGGAGVSSSSMSASLEASSTSSGEEGQAGSVQPPSSAPAPAPGAPSAHLQALGRAIAGAIAKGPPPGYAESMAAQVEARAAAPVPAQAGYGGYQDGYTPADMAWLGIGAGAGAAGSGGDGGQEGAGGWDESEFGLGPATTAASSAVAPSRMPSTASLPPQLVSPRTALRASPAVLQAIGEEEDEEGEEGEGQGRTSGAARSSTASAAPVPSYAHILYTDRPGPLSPPPPPLPKITTRVVASTDGVRVKVLALTGQELLHLWKEKMAALGLFHAAGQARRARVRACKTLTLGLAAARARTRVRDMAVSKVRGRVLALMMACGAMRYRAWVRAEEQAAAARVKAAEEARAAAEAKAASARAAKADMAAAPKLKGIHWDGLGEEALAGTIWALAKGDGVDLQALTSGLVDKFSAVQGGAGGKGAAGRGAGKGEHADTPKEQLLSLVDTKTGKNLGILVAGFMGKRDVASVTHALASMDVAGIGGLDKVQLLLVNRGLWESEEMKALREYTGDIAALVPPERVAKAILSVPGLIPKLQVCEFAATLPELVQGLQERLQLLLAASRELQTSRRFCTLLLDVILPLGNRLNASSKRPVSGFRISSLDKLMQTKASSGETFLQFVVHGLLGTAPTVLQLADDFPALLRTSPSACSKELMDGDLKRLEAGLATVDRLAKSPAVAAEGGALQARLAAVLQEASTALASMRALHSEASEAFSTVCRWLGEDPSPGKVTSYDDHLFKACRAFVLQVGKDTKAMQERAEKARKAEEKKAREDADRAARAARAAALMPGAGHASSSSPALKAAGASPPGSSKGALKKIPGKSTMIQSPAAAAAAAARARAEARAAGAAPTPAGASSTTHNSSVKQLKRPASLSKVGGSPPSAATSLQSTSSPPPSASSAASAGVGSASSSVHRRSTGRDSRRSVGSRAAGEDPLAAFQAPQGADGGVDGMPGVTAVLSPAGSTSSSRAASPALLASPGQPPSAGGSSSSSEEETVMDQSAAVVGAALAEGLRMHRPRSLAEVVASSPEGTPPLASPPATARLSLGAAEGSRSPIPMMNMLSPLSSASSPSSSSPSPEVGGPGGILRAAPEMSPERMPALHPGSAMAATRRSLVRAQTFVQSPGGSMKASGPVLSGAFAPTPRGKAPSTASSSQPAQGGSGAAGVAAARHSGQQDAAMKAALELLHSGSASPEQLQQLAVMVGIDASLIRRLA